MTSIAPDTLAAYQATDYCVEGLQPCILKIGIPHPLLQTLHAQYGVDCSAFLTACNPLSLLQPAEENARRQAALEQSLKQANWRYLPGAGRHPAGDWPAEESVLVLGMPLAEAQRLGNEYGQNAVVWCGPDATPRLILLR